MCCDKRGSSQEPPVVHAGYAAERMCLRMFSEAINNTPAMNSQRGRGRSGNDGSSQLPAGGRAG